MAHFGTFCVIRHMEPIVDAKQKRVFNSFDCPLLLRTNIIHLVPAACLKHAVSVVHQCDSRCRWLEKDQPTQVERELISVNTTVFEHNWNNNKYCFNVHCMSNALYMSNKNYDADVLGAYRVLRRIAGVLKVYTPIHHVL